MKLIKLRILYDNYIYVVSVELIALLSKVDRDITREPVRQCKTPDEPLCLSVKSDTPVGSPSK